MYVISKIDSNKRFFKNIFFFINLRNIKMCMYLNNQTQIPNGVSL